MSHNPYRPSTTAPSLPAHRSLRSGHWLCSIVGSIVLVLLGIVVAGLGMLPSDAPGFFLLSGAHLIASGALSVACGWAWAKRASRIRHLLCWMSIIINAALATRIMILMIDGTIRGPLIAVALLCFGLPAALNVVSAALSLRRDHPLETETP